MMVTHVLACVEDLGQVQATRKRHNTHVCLVDVARPRSCDLHADCMIREDRASKQKTEADT